MLIKVSLGGLRGMQNLPEKHRKLGHLLTAMVAINEDYLLANPQTPNLYDSGVRYSMRYEREGEELADIPTILERGEDDCDGLAPWLAAEYRVRHGIDARPTFQWRVHPSGRGNDYHIVVERRVVRYDDRGRLVESWEIEDPSKRLGM